MLRRTLEIVIVPRKISSHRVILSWPSLDHLPILAKPVNLLDNKFRLRNLIVRHTNTIIKSNVTTSYKYVFLNHGCTFVHPADVPYTET